MGRRRPAERAVIGDVAWNFQYLGVPAMRFPRARFTLRWMMVLVALVALACLGAREYWARSVRRAQPNPVYPSTLSATAGRRNQLDWDDGQPIPVVISYDFRFGNPKPAPGTMCLLLAEVWFEDQKTGLAVEGYSFDAPLVVGGREVASNSFTWDALLPRPGRYMLRYRLNWIEPTGELRLIGGGGTSYHAVPAASSSPTSNRKGANR